jgi:ribosomal protein S2
MNNLLKGNFFSSTGWHLGGFNIEVNKYNILFIYGKRKKSFILDLKDTLFNLKILIFFIIKIMSYRGRVLFYEKRELLKIPLILLASKKGRQFFITSKWIGGALVNFKSFKRFVHAIYKLNSLEFLLKYEKVISFFLGLNLMYSMPSLICITETTPISNVSIQESFKLGLPVAGLVNASSKKITAFTFPIPADFDNLRVVLCFLNFIISSILLGFRKDLYKFYILSLSKNSNFRKKIFSLVLLKKFINYQNYLFRLYKFFFFQNAFFLFNNIKSFFYYISYFKSKKFFSFISQTRFLKFKLKFNFFISLKKKKNNKFSRSLNHMINKLDFIYRSIQKKFEKSIPFFLRSDEELYVVNRKKAIFENIKYLKQLGKLRFRSFMLNMSDKVKNFKRKKLINKKRKSKFYSLKVDKKRLIKKKNFFLDYFKKSILFKKRKLVSFIYFNMIFAAQGSFNNRLLFFKEEQLFYFLPSYDLTFFLNKQKYKLFIKFNRFFFKKSILKYFIKYFNKQNLENIYFNRFRLLNLKFDIKQKNFHYYCLLFNIRVKLFGNDKKNTP